MKIAVIERIEHENIIAVQWHPEVSNDMNLFKKFNDLCNKNIEN